MVLTPRFLLNSKAILIASVFIFSSCQSGTKEESPEYVPVNLPKEEAPAQAGYYCPMKCEGNKVYDSDRYPCPECEMKLVHTK